MTTLLKDNKASRFTMTVHPTADAQLTEMQRIFALPTRAAVFDLAVSFLAWAADQRLSGNTVGRHDGKTFQELLLPRPLLNSVLNASASNVTAFPKPAIDPQSQMAKATGPNGKTNELQQM